jgi:dimeric dUTPase (all-alpha-NTP-PPase superfamily)
MDFIELFERQKEYQKAMGYEFKIPDFSTCMMYMQALNMEQYELLNELPWKPWKNYEHEHKQVNELSVHSEWVDCLIFLINQALALCITPEDIELAIEEVFQKNYTRILNGTSKLKGNETL